MRSATRYEQIVRREGANLEQSWIRGDSLKDTDDLDDPDVIVDELAEDLEAALREFATIASDLQERGEP